MSALLAAVTVLAQSDPYRSPDQWGYVVAGWTLLVLGFVIYVARLLYRGRKLARQLPPEERRWMG